MGPEYTMLSNGVEPAAKGSSRKKPQASPSVASESSSVPALTGSLNVDEEETAGAVDFHSRYDEDFFRRNTSTLRRVHVLSRHAAMTTKQQFWDSNQISIDAALSAVDKWEAAYNALRALLIASSQSAQGLYNAAKEGAGKLEQHGLAPLRDWILLPAFWGLERAVGETASFLQSSQATQLVEQALQLTRNVPVVGENILAPFLMFSAVFLQRSWMIAQYPIPSRQQVHESVDWALTGMKWALSKAGREIYLYIKRADANLTRTLSHTQWKVLGSGPYETLNPLNRKEVIDHLCERYFSLATSAVARYELAAHVRAHNSPLYHDLVLTGVLRQRGGELTADDEWLSSCPSYYQSSEQPFLIRQQGQGVDSTTFSSSNSTVLHDGFALWFRLPNVNGKKPARDAPWICFSRQEQKALEERYINILHEGQDARAVEKKVKYENSHIETLLQDSATMAPEDAQSGRTQDIDYKHPTIAQWYNHDPTFDLLVDQKRQAVSFFLCCPKCRASQSSFIPPLVQRRFGKLCSICDQQQNYIDKSSLPLSTPPEHDIWLAPPPLSMLMRPILWRFHGPGDQVRRATWFLDSGRCGLQPFDEAASVVLEDAYLFLKWMSIRQDDSELEEALLTVEVPCPDGTDRFVQFSSLTRATAIQKGIGAAIAIFKRRVYRGAWLYLSNNDETVENQAIIPLDEEQDETQNVIEESFFRTAECHEEETTSVTPPNIQSVLTSSMSIRSMLTTPEPKKTYNHLKDDRLHESAAVPPVRLEELLGKQLEDVKDGKIDHLILIVHGIGEMFRTIDVFGLSIPNLSSIIDCCAFLRRNHGDVQDANFKEMYPKADAASRAATGRVEYLPVEWHEAFSILSQRRAPSTNSTDSSRVNRQSVMINDISLRTIPNLRDFANDTLMDVLYFMSPEHHDIIVDIVTNEMNIVVNKFRNLHPVEFKGRISVVGHSLGSIIAWDILCNQCPENTPRSEIFSRESTSVSRDTVSGYYSPATLRRYSFGDASACPEWASGLPPPVSSHAPANFLMPSVYPKLDFSVDNFFLLGSPVSVFLMIRNQRKPLSEDFSISGCKRVFNIFHPYDPVAYRLEPCIDPRNADFEPTIMKHWNGGFRVHYHTKRLWRKLVESTWKTQQNVIEAFEASMAGMGLIDSTYETDEDDNDSLDVRVSRVITGRLNQGRRIDYMLQEKEIENANEYVAALAAHSSYWIEKDLSLFITRQIYLSSIESTRDDRDLWEPIQSTL